MQNLSIMGAHCQSAAAKRNVAVATSPVPCSQSSLIILTETLKTPYFTT